MGGNIRKQLHLAEEKQAKYHVVLRNFVVMQEGLIEAPVNHLYWRIFFQKPLTVLIKNSITDGAVMKYLTVELKDRAFIFL